EMAAVGREGRVVAVNADPGDAVDLAELDRLEVPGDLSRVGPAIDTEGGGRDGQTGERGQWSTGGQAPYGSGADSVAAAAQLLQAGRQLLAVESPLRARERSPLNDDALRPPVIACAGRQLLAVARLAPFAEGLQLGPPDLYHTVHDVDSQ